MCVTVSEYLPIENTEAGTGDIENYDSIDVTRLLYVFLSYYSFQKIKSN